MRVRLMLAGLAAGVVAMTFGVSAAPSASAAELPVFAGCSDGSIEVPTGGQFVVSLVVGSCDGFIWDGPVSGVEIDAAPGYACYLFTINDDTILGEIGSWSLPGPGVDYTLSVNGGPGVAAAGSCGGTGDGSGPIPQWVQSYARPSESAACLDGWSPSWAQWPHEGKGGWVCDRTVLAFG